MVYFETQILVYLGSPWGGKLGFYCYLVYFMAMWSVCGHFGAFSPHVAFLHKEKSGNIASGCRDPLLTNSSIFYSNCISIKLCQFTTSKYAYAILVNALTRACLVFIGYIFPRLIGNFDGKSCLLHIQRFISKSFQSQSFFSEESKPNSESSEPGQNFQQR
jgi:hypothetical protein